jgi:hypothetical protein
MHDDLVDETPTLFGIGLNRIIAFAGPYIAVLSGAIADWLLVHLNFLANFHVGNGDLANAVAQAIVFGITALVVWLGQQKWLDGFQKWAYGTATAIINTELPPSARQPVTPADPIDPGLKPEPAPGPPPGPPPEPLGPGGPVPGPPAIAPEPTPTGHPSASPEAAAGFEGTREDDDGEPPASG